MLFSYDVYYSTEVLVNGELVVESNKNDILSLKEGINATIRGISKILNVPIMITFYNQDKIVDVCVAGETDEFTDVNYEKFNISLCQ